MVFGCLEENFKPMNNNQKFTEQNLKQGGSRMQHLWMGAQQGSGGGQQGFSSAPAPQHEGFL